MNKRKPLLLARNCFAYISNLDFFFYQLLIQSKNYYFVFDFAKI